MRKLSPKPSGRPSATALSPSQSGADYVSGPVAMSEFA